MKQFNQQIDLFQVRLKLTLGEFLTFRKTCKNSCLRILTKTTKSNIDNCLEHSAHVSYIDNKLNMASVRSQKMFCDKMQSLKICTHFGMIAILHQYRLLTFC